MSTRYIAEVFPRGSYFILENNRDGNCLFECIDQSYVWNHLENEIQERILTYVDTGGETLSSALSVKVGDLRDLRKNWSRSVLCTLLKDFFAPRNDWKRADQYILPSGITLREGISHQGYEQIVNGRTSFFRQYLELHQRNGFYTDELFLTLITIMVHEYSLLSEEERIDFTEEQKKILETCPYFVVYENKDSHHPLEGPLQRLFFINGGDGTELESNEFTKKAVKLIYTVSPATQNGHYALICVPDSSLDDYQWDQMINPNPREFSIRPVEQTILNHFEQIEVPLDWSQFESSIETSIPSSPSSFPYIEDIIQEVNGSIPILPVFTEIVVPPPENFLEETVSEETRLLQTVPSPDDMDVVVKKATDHYYVSIGISKDQTNEISLGLFSKMYRKKGDYLCLYHGEIIDTAIANQRDYDPTNDYLVELNQKITIDAKSPTSCYGRYARDPVIPELANAVIVPVKGKPKLAQVIATRRINKTDEILIDSGIQYWMEETRYEKLSMEKKNYLQSQPIWRDWYEKRAFPESTSHGVEGAPANIHGELTEQEMIAIEIEPNVYDPSTFPEPTSQEFSALIDEWMNLEENNDSTMNTTLLPVPNTNESNTIPLIPLDDHTIQTNPMRDSRNVTPEEQVLYFKNWNRINKLPLEKYCIAPRVPRESRAEKKRREQENQRCLYEKTFRIKNGVYVFHPIPLRVSYLYRVPHDNLHLGDFFSHREGVLSETDAWKRTKNLFRENYSLSSWEEIMESMIITVFDIVHWVCYSEEYMLQSIEAAIDWSSVAADLFHHSHTVQQNLFTVSNCLLKCLYRALGSEAEAEAFFLKTVPIQDVQNVRDKYSSLVSGLVEQLVIMLCQSSYPGTYLEGGNYLEKIFLNEFWCDICPYIASKKVFEFDMHQMYHIFPVVDAHFTLFMDNMFFLQSVDIPEADNRTKNIFPPAKEEVEIDGKMFSILSSEVQLPYLQPKVALQDYVRGRMNPVAFSTAFYTKYNMALTDIAYKKFSFQIQHYLDRLYYEQQMVFGEVLPSSFLVYEPFLNQPNPPIFNTTVRRKPPKWEFHGAIANRLTPQTTAFTHSFFDGWINTRIKDQHIILRPLQNRGMIRKVLVPPGYAILYPIDKVEVAANIQDEEITLYHRLHLRFHYASIDKEQREGQDHFPASGYVNTALRAQGYRVQDPEYDYTQRGEYTRYFQQIWKAQMAPTDWEGKWYRAHYSSVSEGREEIHPNDPRTKNQIYYKQFATSLVGFENKMYDLVVPSKRLNKNSTAENKVYNVHFTSPLPYFGLPKEISIRPSLAKLGEPKSSRYRDNYRWQNGVFMHLDELNSEPAMPIPTINDWMDQAPRRPNRRKKNPALLNYVALHHPSPNFPILQVELPVDDI